jgi:polyisoprenoid-binding protein YceI
MALALLAPAASGRPATTGDAAGGDYVLDARSASLVVQLARVAGFPGPALRLTKLEGRLHCDPENWTATNVTISADPRSIEASGGPVARRAKALFEPEKFPTIVFTSTSIRWGEGERGEAVGQLTFHGVTRPLSLHVVLRDSNGAGTAAEGRLSFSGRGRVMRSQFGVREGFPLVGDPVDLTFNVDFVKQSAGDATR